jgi:hypothetical protein
MRHAPQDRRSFTWKPLAHPAEIAGLMVISRLTLCRI